MLCTFYDFYQLSGFLFNSSIARFFPLQPNSPLTSRCRYLLRILQVRRKSNPQETDEEAREETCCSCTHLCPHRPHRPHRPIGPIGPISPIGPITQAEDCPADLPSAPARPTPLSCEGPVSILRSASHGLWKPSKDKTLKESRKLLSTGFREPASWWKPVVLTPHHL